MVQFPAFKGLVEGPREKAWLLRRPHEQTVLHHESGWTLRRVLAKKKNSVSQSLCHPEVSLEDLFVCLLHRFSLCAREGVAHVGERIQMEFSKRGQVPSHASLCEHCSLSPSSAKEAVPVWREVFISSFRDRFSHHSSENTFLPRAQDVDDTGAQHSSLSVTFCRSECRLSGMRCMAYGVLVACVPERKPTPPSHVCTSLLFS